MYRLPAVLLSQFDEEPSQWDKGQWDKEQGTTVSAGKYIYSISLGLTPCCLLRGGLLAHGAI